jgi:hypothetical protein
MPASGDLVIPGSVADEPKAAVESSESMPPAAYTSELVGVHTSSSSTPGKMWKSELSNQSRKSESFASNQSGGPSRREEYFLDQAWVKTKHKQSKKKRFTAVSTPLVEHVSSRDSDSSEGILPQHSGSVNESPSHCAFNKNNVEKRASGIFGRCMLTPGSGKRMIWDLLTGVNLCVEAMCTPFVMCFRPEESTLGRITRALATLFWVCDLVITFFTGIQKNGQTVMDPRSVAWKYIRGWLTFDVFLIILDVMALATTASQTVTGFQILRLARTARLLRLFKLRRILNEVTGFFQSDSMLLVLAIMWRLAVIIFLCHILACGWYSVAIHWSPKDRNWVETYNYNNAELFYSYMTSLHWSIAQIHGSMEVSPQSGLERTYAVCSLFMSLFVMAVLVGNFANLIANLWSDANFKNRQLWLLRRYMSQLQISSEVAEKVDTYIQHILSRRMDEVDVDSIEVLKYLSKPLADELKADSYVKYMCHHHLFSFACACSKSFSTVVVDALSTNWLSQGDMVFTCGDASIDVVFLIDANAEYVLFNEGEQEEADDGRDVCMCGNKMMRDAIFCRKCGAPRDLTKSLHNGGHMLTHMRTFNRIRSGTVHSFEEAGSAMSVLRGSANSATNGFGGEMVVVGEWVGEPALWVQEWQSLGDLVVMEACQVVHLNPQKFKEQSKETSWIWDLCSKYAVAFVRRVNETSNELLTDLSYKFVAAESVFDESDIM